MQINENVTIYDIAKELNLSPSTVSRVLNNSDLISNRTSDKIIKTAESLGYKKRKIKKQRRGILNIKIVLDEKNLDNTPAFYDFAKLINTIIQSSQPTTLNIGLNLNRDRTNLFDHKKSGHLDGVIFPFSKPSPGLLDQLNQRGTPLICINRKIENHDSIVINYSKSAEDLYLSLLKKWPNLKPIYIQSIQTNEILINRKKTFQTYFNSHGIPIKQNNFLSIDDFSAIDENLIKTIKKNGYNAIVCMNDQYASSILIKCLQYQLQIPKDISITGFDNSPFQNLLPFKIDTVELPIEKIGVSISQWIKTKIIQKDHVIYSDEILGEYIKGNSI